MVLDINRAKGDVLDVTSSGNYIFITAIRMKSLIKENIITIIKYNKCYVLYMICFINIMNNQLTIILI